MKTLPALLLTLVFASGHVFAHGKGTHDEKKPAIDYSKVEEKAFGKAADPKRATRTITIDMLDSMRFAPDLITVKRGEIIKFVVKNKGNMLHEIVFGSLSELKEHGELMKKFPGMEHDEPHMAHVAPGKTGEIVWQFTRAGEFNYACLLPGHFGAGMVGKVIVK